LITLADKYISGDIDMTMTPTFNIAKSTGSLMGTSPNPLNRTGQTNGATQNLSSANPTNNTTGGSYSFEQVYARLTPFQYPNEVLGSNTNHPLSPIIQSNGVVFPYNPTISEGVNIKYDQIDLTHSNEGYYAYRGTDNVRINISNATWTCDTFDNAVYALAVLHFFRAYSFMDFGRGKTGRPPSPMWFHAYGNYAFNNVPVLMEKADWSFPNDIDYVGIPEPNSPEFQRGYLQTNQQSTGSYTWLPVKFSVSSISLLVQHSPRYWINFSLEDYYSGAMLTNRGNGSFHTQNVPTSAGNITPSTIINSTGNNIR